MWAPRSWPARIIGYGWIEEGCGINVERILRIARPVLILECDISSGAERP